MPIEEVATSTEGFYDVPRARIYISDKLTGDDWEFEPHLYLKRLRLAASPEVDSAEIEWDYARLTHPDDPEEVITENPFEGLQKFLKVQIEDTVDPGRNPITWYGVVEVDQRDVQGSTRDPTGRQTFIAWGLARLLERVTVDRSLVDYVDDEGGTHEVEIGVGLPFNVRERGFMVPDRGNRMHREAIESDGYLFADTADRSEEWNAEQAVEYLLENFPPKNLDGDTLIECVLHSHGEHLLDWYDITVPTDRRTVKDLLDEIINRRRGVGYWCDFDTDTLIVNVFSFLDKELELAAATASTERKVIGANEEQRRLNFERSFDIESAIVRNLSTTVYDVIHVEGERKTATATLDFADVERDRTTLEDVRKLGKYQFVPDWETAQETKYLKAGVADADYAGLDLVQKTERNAYIRSQDALAHVYARFKVHRDWNQHLDDPNIPFIRYSVFRKNDDETDPDTQWVWGLRIFPTTVFRQGVDYSGSKIADGLPEAASFVGPDGVKTERPFLPMILAVPIDSLEGTKWVNGERLNATASYEDGGGRWALSVRALHHAPVINISVTGGPQHFIALDQFSDPTSTLGVTSVGDVDERDNPETNHGLNFTAFKLTLSFEAQGYVTETVELDRKDAPRTRQKRELFIKLHDARADYVVPQTIVAIENGGQVVSESGGYVRDDRPRMKAIAKAASQWYGTERQTLALRFKQIRDFVHVGDLIVDVGETYNRQDVKTTVTAVSYDFSGDVPMTELETSYADLDFS